MDTSQQQNSLQQTGSNLQPNRSDLQPISPTNDQLFQRGVDQQKLPLNSSESLRVETAQPGSALPSGVTQGAPTAEASLLPFFIALAVIVMLMVGLVIAAMKSAKPRTDEEIPPVRKTPKGGSTVTKITTTTATATPKKPVKKSVHKTKLKKKKSKKR